MAEPFGDSGTPAASPQRADRGDHNELDRIRAVTRYGVLDAPADETYDRIAALTAKLLQVPVALVAIVDSGRIWFMSRHGLDLQEVPRDPAETSCVFLHDTPLLVADASQDSRTRFSPLVTNGFGLGFYAAAPLLTNDAYNLGALCAIDRQPRDISPASVALLPELAALVVHEMELRLEIRCAMDMGDTLRQNTRVEKGRAEHLATHDALTGLGNRRKLDAVFAAEFNRLRRHGGSLCLFMADIDHFKNINDRYGHATGDDVLTQFGELLHQQMRPTDTSARIGGEEFVVLMPHTRVREALGTAERLRAAMMEQTFGGLKDAITVSIGVAELQQDEDRESLLRRADQALYVAKRSGRNLVVAADPIVNT